VTRVQQLDQRLTKHVRTRSLEYFGPIAHLTEIAGKKAYLLSFLQIQRTPIASKPSSMLGLRIVQSGLLTCHHMSSGVGHPSYSL
jgi:hypothetical protein